MRKTRSKENTKTLSVNFNSVNNNRDTFTDHLYQHFLGVVYFSKYSGGFKVIYIYLKDGTAGDFVYKTALLA